MFIYRQQSHLLSLLVLETHAYKVCGLPNDPEEWHRHRVQAASKVLLDYFQYEVPYITEGKYLCSTGLALNVTQEVDAKYLFFEKDLRTRAELAEGCSDIPSGKVVIGRDYAEMVSWPAMTPSASILALVDPFRIDCGQGGEVTVRSVWGVLCHKILSLLSTEGTVALLAFDFTTDESKTLWPRGVGLMDGPIAALHRGSSNLALYGAESVWERLDPEFTEIGWRGTR